jgi:hypothetical protein
LVGMRRDVVGRDEIRMDHIPWIVISLGVPMSPMLRNGHVRVPVAHGLISTERTRSMGYDPSLFLGTGNFTY